MKESKVTPVRWDLKTYQLISDEAWRQRKTFSELIRSIVLEKFTKV
jgi:hypothetical protein